MRIPVLLAILSYLVLILTDLYILWDIKSSFKENRRKRKGWLIGYGVFAIAILAVLTVGLCLPHKSVSSGILALIWLFYIVITVVISQIIYVLLSLPGRIPQLFRKRRIPTGKWFGLPFALLVFCLMWWGALVGRNQLQVNEVKFDSENLPQSFDGYRIVQISDLHVGTWGENTAFIDKLVDKINDLHPDLVVFTGDIVNRESSELEPFVNSLSKLRAKDGVVSVLGNHDYGDYIIWNSQKEKLENLDNLRKMQAKMGWRLLENNYLPIKNERGDSIMIIGVGNWGEPPFSQYGDLRAAYKGDLKDDNFKILLSHNPEHWNREVSKVSNIDLTLAGHTHAMQMLIKLGPWKWSPSEFKYEQWGGLYERNNPDNQSMHLYVNIGAGEVGFPMRLGATPEITVFDLESRKKD